MRKDAGSSTPTGGILHVHDVVEVKLKRTVSPKSKPLYYLLILHLCLKFYKVILKVVGIISLLTTS